MGEIGGKVYRCSVCHEKFSVGDVIALVARGQIVIDPSNRGCQLLEQIPNNSGTGLDVVCVDCASALTVFDMIRDEDRE